MRDALISRLHLLLPHYSAAELSEHEAWFQRLRLVRQRHVDLGAGEHRARQQPWAPASIALPAALC